jgi:surface antigen
MMKCTNIRLLSVLLAAIFLTSAVGCENRAQQGSVFGALAGAAIGGQLGPSSQSVTNALIGAGIGLALGYIVGNEWDKNDQQQLNNTLEYTPSGQTVEWRNPDTGREYRATPSPAYAKDDRIYRDVDLIADVDGKEERVKARAYRDNNGQWVLVQ